MNYKRTSSWLFAFAIAAMLFTACNNKGSQTEGKNVKDSIEVCRIDTVPVQNGPDKTVYGKADEFGMSTFTLITGSGEEYDVTRVSEGGKESRIYGSTVPGQRYAMLLDKSGEALKVLINVDELEKFVTDYYIYNGQLVLTMDGNRDWVDIESLSADGFKAKGKSGKVYSFTAKK